jgi:hypothetical protein
LKVSLNERSLPNHAKPCLLVKGIFHKLLVGCVLHIIIDDAPIGRHLWGITATKEQERDGTQRNGDR